MDLILALVLLRFDACGFGEPDSDGKIHFGEAPNVEFIYISPEHVSSVISIREGSTWYGGPDCVIVYTGGVGRAVKGAHKDVVRKLMQHGYKPKAGGAE